MGVFPEDTQIVVSSLISLWVVEGFLKPIAAKSLEEVAEEYLKDLIDRNLILVHKLGCSGKVQYCKIHDLLRDLCLREGQKDKFLWVRTVNDLDNLKGIQSQRRISIHEGASKEKYDIDRVIEALPSTSLARSLKCYFSGVYLSSNRIRLVRVFNMGRKYMYKAVRCSDTEIFMLVNSRYLNFETEWNSTSGLPSFIHPLWNLQTLIIKDYTPDIHVPLEIWGVSQLRHLDIRNLYLQNPPNVPLIHEGDDDDFVLRNLHTLKTVRNFELSKEVIKRIPNIKKLKLLYDVFYYKEPCPNYGFNNLGLLNKLESLNIHSFFSSLSLQKIALPHSLKQLSLSKIDLLWEDERMIGSLPHLQVLKLSCHYFRGPEWNPVEGEFRCLKFLKIHGFDDLECWNANRTHFPCLEQLVLRYLPNLKEIPLDIGQIPTLRSIELWQCENDVVMSAKNLLDEQVGLGNEDLRIRVVCDEKGQFERLTTQNFQVDFHW